MRGRDGDWEGGWGLATDIRGTEGERERGVGRSMHSERTRDRQTGE